MSFFEAVILGIIQGLTEFLPVSSSGHIELGKAILGIELSDPLLLSIVLHAATALSTIVIFRKDIIQIVKGCFQFKWNDEAKFVVLIIVSMVPAGLVGLFLEDQIEAFFSGNLLLVGIMLVITGVLLIFADLAKKTEKKVTLADSIIVGIAQAIAILPGISRSGATISTSVILGVDRAKAARFSFLMVVPLILGAALLDVKKFRDINELESLAAEERTELIMADLIEDQVVSETEFSSVRMAVLQKEKRWDFFKAKIGNNMGEGALGRESELTKEFSTDLEARVKAATRSAILTSSMAGVRPLSPIGLWTLFVGFLTAFATGLVACTWMIKLVKKSKLRYFSYYCFLVGIIATVYSLL